MWQFRRAAFGSNQDKTFNRSAVEPQPKATPSTRSQRSKQREDEENQNFTTEARRH